MLSAFQPDEQKRSVEFSALNLITRGTRPDTEIVLSMLEMGRQQKLKQLKEALAEVLVVRAPRAEWQDSEEDTHS